MVEEVVEVGKSSPFCKYPGALDIPPVLKNLALLASELSAWGGLSFINFVDFLITPGEKSVITVTCSIAGLGIAFYQYNSFSVCPVDD